MDEDVELDKYRSLDLPRDDEDKRGEKHGPSRRSRMGRKWRKVEENVKQRFMSSKLLSQVPTASFVKTQPREELLSTASSAITAA